MWTNTDTLCLLHVYCLMSHDYYKVPKGTLVIWLFSSELPWWPWLTHFILECTRTLEFVFAVVRSLLKLHIVGASLVGTWWWMNSERFRDFRDCLESFSESLAVEAARRHHLSAQNEESSVWGLHKLYITSLGRHDAMESLNQRLRAIRFWNQVKQPQIKSYIYQIAFFFFFAISNSNIIWDY